MNVVKSTKDLLPSNFDMKDLGEADVILGIKIIKNSEGITLCQSHYVERALKKFNHFDCDPVRTPYDEGCAWFARVGYFLNLSPNQ